MRCRRPIILTSVVAVAALGLLAAGCGGGGKSPGVASVAASTTTATTTTTTQSGSASARQAARPGSGGGQFQIGMRVGNAADGAKFSACMRKHGVTNFPDPNSQGVITIHSGMGIDPGSPAFQSARTACDKLLPNGGQPTPAQIAQRSSRCSPSRPACARTGSRTSPIPSNGGLRIQVHPGSDLDPNNPTFQKAQQACQKDLPFKAGRGRRRPAVAEPVTRVAPSGARSRRRLLLAGLAVLLVAAGVAVAVSGSVRGQLAAGERGHPTTRRPPRWRR